MPILILLDLFWSAAAWFYDAEKLLTIPPYFWLLVAVCPIYPLLLALVLVQLYLKRKPNQFLFAFAVIPSIVFGVLALFYYPIAMTYQGFSWNALGQIFWVWFYAGQGVWLFRKYKIKPLPFTVAGLFLAIQLTFEFYTKSYSYFDFDKIPQFLLIGLLSLGIFSIFFLALWRRLLTS